MTEADAVEAMTQTFLTAWSVAQPTVPVLLENEVGATADAWARFSIIHTTREQTTHGPTGGRRFEARGYMFVQVFGGVDGGRRLTSQLADSARAALDSIRIAVAGDDEPINTYAGASRESPTDGRWFQTTITVPFVYYSIA